MEYVSTAKWRERRWRLFSTFPCEKNSEKSKLVFSLYKQPWIQLVSATRVSWLFLAGSSKFHGGFQDQFANSLSAPAYSLHTVFKQPKTLKNQTLLPF